MSKRLIAVLAGVVAIAVIAVGCGSSDDSLSKAEYIKQGDAICKKGGAEIEKDVTAYAKENDIDLQKQPSDDQLEELSEEVVLPGIQDQLDNLSDLGTPKEDEETLTKLFEALEEGIEKGEEDPVAFVSEEDSLADANKLAKEFGFQECGQE